MTALTEFFFRYPDRPRNAWSIINWWESRRLAYNLSVGATGLVALGVAKILLILPPHPWYLGIAWQPVLAYAILANVCYTMGPAAELAIRRLGGDELAPVGPALFRYGFAFSIGLTLMPVCLAALGWLVRVGMLLV